MYPEISKYRWRYERDRQRVRAVITKGEGRVNLSHLVLRLFDRSYVEVFHLNGDKLDFRLCNLVPYDRTIYGHERVFKGEKKKFKGVSYRTSDGVWTAVLRYKGKLLHLGSFSSAVDAGEAYARKHKELIQPLKESPPKRLKHSKIFTWKSNV